MESNELKNIIPIKSIWEDLDLLEDRLIEISLAIKIGIPRYCRNTHYDTYVMCQS